MRTEVFVHSFGRLVAFCAYARSLCHPFVTFTYRGASTMFMTTPVKGGGLWDGVVLVPDVISDFYKAMPDDELNITNLMVVLFVWSCVVVPPLATLALLLADVAELGALPARVRARALRAVRYLAPWSGAGPLAVCSLFVACLLYTSPSPRDATLSRMPSSA